MQNLPNTISLGIQSQKVPQLEVKQSKYFQKWPMPYTFLSMISKPFYYSVTFIIIIENTASGTLVVLVVNANIVYKLDCISYIKIFRI